MVDVIEFIVLSKFDCLVYRYLASQTHSEPKSGITLRRRMECAENGRGDQFCVQWDDGDVIPLQELVNALIVLNIVLTITYSHQRLRRRDYNGLKAKALRFQSVVVSSSKHSCISPTIKALILAMVSHHHHLIEHRNGPHAHSPHIPFSAGFSSWQQV